MRSVFAERRAHDSAASRPQHRPSAAALILLVVGVLTLASCRDGAAEAPPSSAIAEPAPAGVATGTQREHDNVLLIVVDSLRRDHMSTYGYARNTTPRISELARDGVLYRGAVSQAPWTTPSIASLMTSHYPSTLGIEDSRSVLPESLETLAELLRDSGYATAAVVSHSFCSSDWGFAQGFERFDESNILGHDAVTSGGVSDRGIEFLESVTEASETRPWLLFLHYFDPHFAYIEHEDFRFTDPGPAYEGPVDSGMLFSELNDMRRQLGADDLRAIARFYDSELAYTDAQIGRVLDTLRNSGQYESTLVVIAADHGEEFLDHGRLGHAKTLFDELVSIPLVIKYPRVPPAVIDAPVGLIDVYPTIAEFVGARTPRSVRGQSLYDTNTGSHRAPPHVFSETSRYAELRALVEDEYKLVLNLETGRPLLFDRRADPGERLNLADRDPRRTERMTRRVRELIELTREDLSETLRRSLSPEEEERLRQLGYL